MVHFASIDLEDWYHDVERVQPVDAASFDRAFDRQVERLVEILDRSQTRATFFVLGKTAERHPGWIARLARDGHEIASHGYGHQRVTSLSQDAFREDLRRSIEVIEGLTSVRPRGYRAPYLSVGARELSFLYEVLADEGFAYSSSVLPARVPGHRLEPGRVSTSLDRSVLEIPLASLALGPGRLHRSVPIAGGGFWRALPLPVIERGIRKLEDQGRPMAIYVHPHELDPYPLRSHRGRRRNLYVNLGRDGVASKLATVLERFSFQPMNTAIDDGSTESVPDEGG